MRKMAVVVIGAMLCAGLGACGGSNTGSSGHGVFTTIGTTAITAGAPMNPFNASGTSFATYDQLDLGYTENLSTEPNADFPALAASWTPVANGLIVHIQPKAGWSDGKPVTAQDVKTSVAIAFAEGTQPTNLQGVTVMGPKTIELTTMPGTKNQLFTSEALETIIVPSFEYQSQLPANIWSIIATSLGTGSAATAAKAKLGTVGKSIDTFAPKTDIAAGPFAIKRVSPGDVLMVKNPHFFDASAIAPSEVILRNYSGNAEIWGYLEAGQLDAAPYVSTPTNVLNKILAASGSQEKNSLSYTAASLAFNEKDYPYGITAVRQALAYLLNRPAITAVGEAVSGTAATTQTGMIDPAVPDWLTSSQQSALNPYNYSPAKATTLLDGAGFTKKGGQWYLPNGKPWKMTIEAVTGFSDWIAADSYMSSQLTSDGIPTTSSIASDYATYLANIAAGDYAVGFWLNALGPSIANAYDRVWGANINAVGSQPSPTTNDFLHTPATYTLSGYGTINPNTLSESLSNLSTAQAKPVVAQLAAAYDQELPMITLWDYRLVQFVNTKRFTDYPTNQGLLANPPGLWMWNGYVHAG